jgi:serine/threonine protein kinase
VNCVPFPFQDVAIKILRSPTSEQEGTDMTSLFRQEVKMLAQLDHPNIVQASPLLSACPSPKPIQKEPGD